MESDPYWWSISDRDELFGFLQDFNFQDEEKYKPFMRKFLLFHYKQNLILKKNTSEQINQLETIKEQNRILISLTETVSARLGVLLLLVILVIGYWFFKM